MQAPLGNLVPQAGVDPLLEQVLGALHVTRRRGVVLLDVGYPELRKRVHHHGLLLKRQETLSGRVERQHPGIESAHFHHQRHLEMQARWDVMALHSTKLQKHRPLELRNNEQ